MNTATDESVSLHYLPIAGTDARRLAARLKIRAEEIHLHQFPDGELRVTIGPASATAIIYAPLAHPNDKLISLILAAETLRQAGARRLVLVAPYLCYMRQDAAFHPGEAVSQKVIGRLLADHVDRIVTVDAHLHRTSSIGEVFPGIEADNLSAMPAIADHLRAAGIDPATLIVGPDTESRQWISDLAGRLGLEFIVGEKTRRDDRSVVISFAEPKLFAGRPTLLVDDIVAAGGTLMTCAETLRGAGAKSIDAIITHALFDDHLTAYFSTSGLRSIRSTTSVPHPTNAVMLDEVLIGALEREMGRAPANGTSQ